MYWAGHSRGDVGWDTEAGRGGVFDGEATSCLSRGVTCSVTDIVADFVATQRADGQRDRTAVCGIDSGDYDVLADVALAVIAGADAGEGIDQAVGVMAFEDVGLTTDRQGL